MILISRYVAGTTVPLVSFADVKIARLNRVENFMIPGKHMVNQKLH
jgi:hypothetical protein